MLFKIANHVFPKFYRLFTANKSELTPSRETKLFPSLSIEPIRDNRNSLVKDAQQRVELFERRDTLSFPFQTLFPTRFTCYTINYRYHPISFMKRILSNLNYSLEMSSFDPLQHLLFLTTVI